MVIHLQLSIKHHRLAKTNAKKLQARAVHYNSLETIIFIWNQNRFRKLEKTIKNWALFLILLPGVTRNVDKVKAVH